MRLGTELVVLTFPCECGTMAVPVETVTVESHRMTIITVIGPAVIRPTKAMVTAIAVTVRRAFDIRAVTSVPLESVSQTTLL